MPPKGDQNGTSWQSDSDQSQSAQLPPHIDSTLKGCVRPTRKLPREPLPERREGRRGFHDTPQESVSAPLISTAKAPETKNWNNRT
jgi:hypothetical protein